MLGGIWRGLGGVGWGFCRGVGVGVDGEGRGKEGGVRMGSANGWWRAPRGGGGVKELIPSCKSIRRN